MRDGIFHSSGLAIVAAGGGAGVITRPFQLVDQHPGSGGEGEEKSNKELARSGNRSRANRRGENFTAAGGDK